MGGLYHNEAPPQYSVRYRINFALPTYACESRDSPMPAFGTTAAFGSRLTLKKSLLWEPESFAANAVVRDWAEWRRRGLRRIEGLCPGRI